MDKILLNALRTLLVTVGVLLSFGSFSARRLTFDPSTTPCRNEVFAQRVAIAGTIAVLVKVEHKEGAVHYVLVTFVRQKLCVQLQVIKEN